MKTPVAFKMEPGYLPPFGRKDAPSEPLAVFPEAREPRPFSGIFRCYAHEGQHSTATESYVDALVDAKPEEYSALLLELAAIGYDVEVVRWDDAKAKPAPGDGKMKA